MSVQCPTVNRTLEHTWENKTLISRVVKIAGDFGQTFSVELRDKMADELNACPQNSTSWKAIQKLKLTSNMWVILHSDISAGVICTNVLSLGKEKPPPKSPNVIIKFQNTLYHTATRTEEIERVFSQTYTHHFMVHIWLHKPATLASQNSNVNTINLQIQELLPGNF